MIDKYSGIAKFINKIYPTLRLASFPTKKEDQPRSHYLHFINDPLCEHKRIPVHNIVANDGIMKTFVEKEIDRVNIPLMMILAGKEHDGVICNKAAKNFFDVAPIEDKAIV